MYVITGATGNIGSKITARLISEGKPVRLIGRTEDRLKNLAGGKAEMSVGTIEDTNFLTKAFTGATAVFAMIPPNIKAENARGFQYNVGKNITTALKNAGVKHVVSLSSIGAHLAENAGIVQGLYDFEQMLNKLKDTNVLHLRAGYFMENLFSTMDSIKKYNLIGTPIRADLQFPMVATQDIAEKAAERLLKLDFTGKSVEYVLGPQDMTYGEITEIIGKAIGRKDLQYIETSYDDTQHALEGMGISKSFSEAMVQLMKGMNDGIILEDAHRTPENTTKTTLRDFAKEFARAYGK